MSYTIKARWVDIEDAEIDANVRYANGEPCLAVWHAECYGRPEVLSVNLVEYGLVPPTGHVYVRDYAQHEGLVAALMEAGIAEPVEQVTYGDYDAQAWLMRVTGQ
jgi:hypothetical protein